MLDGNPLVMMNMNSMMGMNGFNAMIIGDGIPSMNMMGTRFNGLANGIFNGREMLIR